MATWDHEVAAHLVNHMSVSYDPLHLALRLTVPAKDVRLLSPYLQELFLETVVDCWKKEFPERELEELLLTLSPEES